MKVDEDCAIPARLDLTIWTIGAYHTEAGRVREDQPRDLDGRRPLVGQRDLLRATRGADWLRREHELRRSHDESRLRLIDAGEQEGEQGYNGTRACARGIAPPVAASAGQLHVERVGVHGSHQPFLTCCSGLVPAQATHRPLLERERSADAYRRFADDWRGWGTECA